MRRLDRIAVLGLTVVLASFLLGSSAQAARLHVPADYATIQEAHDAADPGDTIIVAEGVFEGAVISKEIHIKGEGDMTIITALPDQPFGASGPKAGFFLPSAYANGTTIEKLKFEPFDPDNAPDDGVSFPVFCRFVDGVTVKSVESDRCVQGVTLTGATNSVVTGCKFSGVTTYFAGGGGIGVTTGGQAEGIEISNNRITLAELFDPINFSPVGISVIGAPVGSYAGSAHDVLIQRNNIEVLAAAPTEGTQGIEIGTHAAYLPDQCPPHTAVVVHSNRICVPDPDLAIVYREIDDVTLSRNKLCSEKKKKGHAPAGLSTYR